MSDRLSLPPLYAITDLRLAREITHSALVGRLVAAGVRLVQIRDTSLPGGTLFGDAAAAVTTARAAGATLIINDRVDIALLSAASGVHLGDEDLPASSARRLLGPDRIVGVSTHSPVEALEVADGPVDYVAIGPIYPSDTKPTQRMPLGPEAIAWVRARTDRPLVAIGGITERTAAEVLDAGADSVAMIGGLFGARGGTAGLEERIARLLATCRRRPR